MIDKSKWINTLPDSSFKNDEEINKLDFEKWTNTIPKKNSYNSIKKYSLLSVLFVSGLLLVSIVKNETRGLQKEINELEASISIINFNLEQAILDNEVITSPENISLLAKEHLDKELTSYKRSQIKKLDSKNTEFTAVNIIDDHKINEEKLNNLKKSIKSKISNKIDNKKNKIKKIYSDPKSIPKEVKKQIKTGIQEKKDEIKSIYHEPDEVLTVQRIGKWGAIQLVKAFIGMPIVPGR